MIIKTSKENIEKAFNKANAKFHGNLTMPKIEPQNGKDNRYVVRLSVIDSRGPGGRISPSGRRVKAACWHAHGEFMSALPDGTEIRTSGKVKYAGGMWEDWNIGSIVNPFYFSEACDCQGKE